MTNTTKDDATIEAILDAEAKERLYQEIDSRMALVRAIEKKLVDLDSATLIRIAKLIR